MTRYGVKNFTRIAYNKVNGDTSSLEGLEEWLKSWFCFKYNTTENDDRLLDMTLEELLVLHQMHRVNEDPVEVKVELDGRTSEQEDHEEWLKKEMGDDYITDEEMIEGMRAEEEEYQEKMNKLKKDLPTKVTTDFSQFDRE